MRTIKEIESNADRIKQAMKTIFLQSAILYEEYQSMALEETGHTDPQIERMRSTLDNAWNVLNTMRQMEEDLASDKRCWSKRD